MKANGTNEKKDEKKGFTLVEVKIVLVIVAILAAVLIPALITYIEKTREKQNSSVANTVVTSAQFYLEDNMD